MLITAYWKPGLNWTFLIFFIKITVQSIQLPRGNFNLTNKKRVFYRCTRYCIKRYWYSSVPEADRCWCNIKTVAGAGQRGNVGLPAVAGARKSDWSSMVQGWQGSLDHLGLVIVTCHGTISGDRSPHPQCSLVISCSHVHLSFTSWPPTTTFPLWPPIKLTMKLSLSPFLSH